MEYTALFEEQIPISSLDLKNDIKSFDTIIEGKLCKLLEGKCSRHGFVKRDSVKLLSRSMGALERGRFTGDLIFNVQAEGVVINPPDGFILQGEVIRKNKMGIYVNYMDAVRIILPRDINIGNDEFESVEVGERINVEVKKSRFQVNDEYILSVGLFKGRKNTSNSKGLRAELFNGEEAVEKDEEEGVEEEEAAEEEEEEAIEEEEEEAIEEEAIEEEEEEAVEEEV